TQPLSSIPKHRIVAFRSRIFFHSSTISLGALFQEYPLRPIKATNPDFPSSPVPSMTCVIFQLFFRIFSRLSDHSSGTLRVQYPLSPRINTALSFPKRATSLNRSPFALKSFRFLRISSLKPDQLYPLEPLRTMNVSPSFAHRNRRTGSCGYCRSMLVNVR